MERQYSEQPSGSWPERAETQSVENSALPRVRERNLVSLLVASIVVLTGFFASTVFRGRIPTHGDLSHWILPLRHFYARCLEQGDAFDWMPDLLCGYFMSGGGGLGFFHPVTWLLYRFLPIQVAFCLEILWPIILLSTGLVFFLRRYVSLAGACMGGLAGGFSFMFVEYMHTTSMSAVLAHIPWLLAAIAAAIEAKTSRQRVLACVAIAAITGSQTLFGWPQSMWFSLMASGLFTLFMAIGRRVGIGAWLAIIGGKLLGLGLGAVELESMYSMFANSTRSATDVTKLPFPLVEPKSFLDIPSAFMSWGALNSNYYGAVPLILILWWFALEGKRLWQLRESHNSITTGTAELTSSDALIRRLALWASILAILTAWLSTGLKGKLYYLQLWLPVVGSFRAPNRMLIITQFCTAILAAIAFSHLLSLVRNNRITPRKYLVLPWIAVAVATFLAVRYDVRESRNLLQHAFFASGPLLMCGAALGLTLATRGRQQGLFLLVLVTAFDYGMYTVCNPGAGRIFFRGLPSYERFVAECSGPPTANEGRVLYNDARHGWSPAENCIYLRGYRLLNGYTSLYPRKTLDYTHENALRVAQVAWVWNQVKVSDDCVAGWGALGPPIEGWWRPVANPLPRARLVSNVAVSTSPGEDLKHIPVDTTALVTRPLDLPPSAVGDSQIVLDRPGRISVTVDVPERQLLVISESHHLDWQARIDGQPVPVEQVNGDFFGCVVEAGNHRVDFEFHPANRQLALNITMATVAVLICMVLVSGLSPRVREQSHRRIQQARSLSEGNSVAFAK